MDKEHINIEEESFDSGEYSSVVCFDSEILKYELRLIEDIKKILSIGGEIEKDKKDKIAKQLLKSCSDEDKVKNYAMLIAMLNGTPTRDIDISVNDNSLIKITEVFIDLFLKNDDVTLLIEVLKIHNLKQILFADIKIDEIFKNKDKILARAKALKHVYSLNNEITMQELVLLSKVAGYGIKIKSQRNVEYSISDIVCKTDNYAKILSIIKTLNNLMNTKGANFSSNNISEIANVASIAVLDDTEKKFVFPFAEMLLEADIKDISVISKAIFTLYNAGVSIDNIHIIIDDLNAEQLKQITSDVANVLKGLTNEEESAVKASVINILAERNVSSKNIVAFIKNLSKEELQIIVDIAETSCIGDKFFSSLKNEDWTTEDVKEAFKKLVVYDTVHKFISLTEKIRDEDTFNIYKEGLSKIFGEKITKKFKDFKKEIQKRVTIAEQIENNGFDSLSEVDKNFVKSNEFLGNQTGKVNLTSEQKAFILLHPVECEVILLKAEKVSDDKIRGVTTESLLDKAIMDSFDQVSVSYGIFGKEGIGSAIPKADELSEGTRKKFVSLVKKSSGINAITLREVGLELSNTNETEANQVFTKLELVVKNFREKHSRLLENAEKLKQLGLSTKSKVGDKDAEKCFEVLESMHPFYKFRGINPENESKDKSEEKFDTKENAKIQTEVLKVVYGEVTAENFPNLPKNYRAIKHFKNQKTMEYVSKDKLFILRGFNMGGKTLDITITSVDKDNTRLPEFFEVLRVEGVMKALSRVTEFFSKDSGFSMNESKIKGTQQCR